MLDGPMGTELVVRGVATPLPGWSAHAIDTAPDVVRDIHRDYAVAGADVHTANTFRTRPRQFPDRWRELTQRAVELAREGTQGFKRRVAGSIAPIEDCYSPELSPDDPRAEHREMARALATAGADLLLVETFPHVGEALIAVEEALDTGVATWASFTAGPDADLLTVDEIRAGAERAVSLGAGAVLVNCIPTHRTTEFLAAVCDLGVPFGAYANAGRANDEVGFSSDPASCDGYLAAAREWVDAGASIVGGCCGTGVAQIRELAAELK